MSAFVGKKEFYIIKMHSTTIKKMTEKYSYDFVTAVSVDTKC